MRSILLMIVGLFLFAGIAEIGFTQTQSDNALKQLRIRIGANGSSDLWEINESWANTDLNRDLFNHPRTGVYLYNKNTDGSLRSSIIATLDNTWNRMVYYSVPEGYIKSFGSAGSGDCQFLWPRSMAAHVVSPDIYDIYIADTYNNRVVCAGFVQQYDGVFCRTVVPNITCDGMYRPIDVALYNGGTYYDIEDDKIWVLSDNNKLMRFSVLGPLECTIVLPANMKATAIATDIDELASEGVWVAMSNTEVSEIRRYTLGGVWVPAATKTCAYPIVDLHFDAYDHLWALNDSNAVFTKYHEFDPDPLCTFGSPGTGTNQFAMPCAFTITAGPYLCGSVFITEDWSDSTGLLHLRCRH